MIAKHREDRWTTLISNWNPAITTRQKVVSEASNTGQEMGRRHQLIPSTNHSSQRRQRSHERHDLARLGTRRLEMGLHEKGLHKQQTQTTNATHDPDRHDNHSQTNNNSRTINTRD